MPLGHLLFPLRAVGTSYGAPLAYDLLPLSSDKAETGILPARTLAVEPDCYAKGRWQCIRSISSLSTRVGAEFSGTNDHGAAVEAPQVNAFEIGDR